MPYQKILVALDKSEENKYIFQTALNIATPEKTTLKLVHCLSMESGKVTNLANIYGQEVIKFSLFNYLDNEFKLVENCLKNYEKEARNKKIDCESILQIGEPSSLIREIANNWPADLVIIGRRGLSGLAEFFLGSVSNHVIHHVKCSVLVVQPTINNS